MTDHPHGDGAAVDRLLAAARARITPRVTAAELTGVLAAGAAAGLPSHPVSDKRSSRTGPSPPAGPAPLRGHPGRTEPPRPTDR